MTIAERQLKDQTDKLREAAESMELLLLGAVAKMPEMEREAIRNCKQELETAINDIKSRYEPGVFGAAEAILTAEQMSKH